MARYTGAKWRLSRRENYSVYDTEDWKRRPSKPGQHGSASRRITSSYSIQFREKQKVKRIYGMLEKQFRRFFKIASSSKGSTGIKLLQLLELRLDNAVYRAGFTKTRPQARQFVSHGHILVNGKKVDIPSYILKVGDEVTLISKIANKEFIKLVKEERKQSATHINWLDLLQNGFSVKSEPTREMIDQSLNEQAIVEFYSR